MDEKFAVLFWTDFQVGELKFQLWTFSLPVVVIVHGNQVWYPLMKVYDFVKVSTKILRVFRKPGGFTQFYLEKFR